jgi:uncharacterized protein YggE
LDRNPNEEEMPMTSVAFGFRPPEGITVFGEASRDAVPETVVLFFEIHTAGPTAMLAHQENAMKARQISQAVSTVAAGRSDIQAGGIAVWPVPQATLSALSLMARSPMMALPVFGSPAGGSMMPAMPEPPAAAIYEAVSSMKVALREPNRVAEVVDVVSKVGSNLAVGIRFLAQEEESVRRSLLEEAVRETRQTADSLAAAIGKTAGSPISICEDFTAYSPQWANGSGVRHGVLPMTAGRLPLASQLLTYFARVSVTYPIQ